MRESVVVFLKGVASAIIAGTAILLCLFIVSLIASPVSAEVFIYGDNYNYSENILPNNSYVHQGQNISQGRYYQLGGIYGFSGQLAHWKDRWNDGVGAPTEIVTISGSPYANTYIDPKIFPEGRWYQWDGMNCEDGSCDSPSRHGNNYVFYVVKAENIITGSANVKTTSVPMVYHANISIRYGDEVIEIPVTAAVTVQVVQPNPTESGVENVTTIIIPPPVTPTPEVTSIEIVTPKAPGNIFIPVISVLFLILVWRVRT